jgi:hypothetical protein
MLNKNHIRGLLLSCGLNPRMASCEIHDRRSGTEANIFLRVFLVFPAIHQLTIASYSSVIVP